MKTCGNESAVRQTHDHVEREKSTEAFSGVVCLIPISAQPGEFVINFGEMLGFWTGGIVQATPHRVVGGDAERISVPLFFNPSHDTNVAPPESGKVVRAGKHLERRFSETYLHLQKP